MQCIGRTKLKSRCKNECQFLLCKKHRWQPFVFFFTIVVVFLTLSDLTDRLIGEETVTHKDIADLAEKDRLIERINANYGELVDTSEVKIPLIGMGYGGTIFKISGNGVMNLDNFGDFLKVFIKDDKLFISTVLRNEIGEVIAVIENNIWTLFNKNYEYNDDDKVFEIVSKGERKVFFHIELKNGIAFIEGYLFNNNGYGMCWYTAPGENGKSGGLMTIIKNGKLVPPAVEIKKLFQYPRGKFYGIRKSQ